MAVESCVRSGGMEGAVVNLGVRYGLGYVGACLLLSRLVVSAGV